ncbi:MAG: Gfo/Idh/MocA family oxidoreductase [Victivallales bacterium]|nr:Gfo/Idh/MocA family oxidoreductase [Victivallales bacterium]
MTMNPSPIVNFGVIGANPQLRAHFVFNNFPRDKAALLAVCDRDPVMRKRFQETYPEFSNVRIYSDYRDLVQDPDLQAVFIVVRDSFHEEIAVAALEAGKAVYLEKPMAITIEGCDRILETAFRTGAKLMVGHNMRYMDFVLKMKEIIDSGIIGEIQCVWCRHFVGYGSCYFRHWCAERENCTGLLLQKGAHDIDIIHWLAGGYTQRVTAMGRLSVYNRTGNRLQPGELPDRKISFTPEAWPPLELKGLNPHIDVEDHSMLLMQLDNGVQASYEQCMYAPDSERNYTFIGTRGRIENVGDYNGKCEIHVWTQRGSRQEPDIVYHVKSRTGTHGGSDPQILNSFFDFLREGTPPSVSPVAARNAVAAGFLGHYSMRNGNVPATVPPLRPELIQYFENGQASY